MLARLRAVPAEKIFYVELADVVPPTTALGKGSRFDEWRAKANSPRGDTFVWATCGRCLPEVGTDAGRGGEKGGARVAEALRAILETGFNGGFLISFGCTCTSETSRTVCAFTDQPRRTVDV